MTRRRARPVPSDLADVYSAASRTYKKMQEAEHGSDLESELRRRYARLMSKYKDLLEEEPDA